MKKPVALYGFVLIFLSLLFVQLSAEVTVTYSAVATPYSAVWQRICESQPPAFYTDPNSSNSPSVGRYDGIYPPAGCEDRFRGYMQFDISNIPDGSKILWSALFMTNNTDVGLPVPLKIVSMASRPSTSSPETIWNNCGNGATYFTQSINGVGCFSSFALDTNDAINITIHNQLTANWFAIGMLSEQEYINPKWARFNMGCNVPLNYWLTVTYEPPPPPPGGGGGSCPFLYVWNGSDFEEDNTILTQTEFSPKEQTVTDYYLVQKPLVAKNNQYHLQLKELTEEKSFIDHIQLLTVDHPIDQNIAVTQEGKIVYTERELAPVAAVDDRGEDQLAKVLAKDGLFYTSQQAGFIELTFPNSENNQKDKMIFVTPAPTKIRVCKISPLDPPEPKLELIKTEIQDINGNWIELTQAPPRDNYALNYWLVDQNQIELGNTFKIRISWQQSYSADEIKFYLITEQIPIANTYSPLTASHSKTGSILKLVSSEDRQFATLNKGENLDLFFPAQNLPLPEGYTRNFIVKASGYYIPYAPGPTASVPDRFELKDNYPNPFNSSTEIAFALPQESDVKLAIYNIMGQKVKTLFEGRKNAGVHKITWDGKNDKGEVVASGVYLYTITTGAYSATKKMTLLK